MSSKMEFINIFFLNKEYKMLQLSVLKKFILQNKKKKINLFTS